MDHDPCARASMNAQHTTPALPRGYNLFRYARARPRLCRHTRPGHSGTATAHSRKLTCSQDRGFSDRIRTRGAGAE
jgi:hypothetical protein